MTLSAGRTDVAAAAAAREDELNELIRAIEDRRWSEGLDRIAALRRRDAGFARERLADAEQRCLLGERYDQACEELNRGSQALDASDWPAAAEALAAAHAGFKEVIGRTNGFPLFLESGDLLRRSLEAERRIDGCRALAEARAAGEQRAAQMLERELQELDRQLGGFARMQSQAVEAFRSQCTELDSAGWQEVIGQLRRIEQLRGQSSWLDDYFIEAPRLLDAAQAARRLAAEVEAGLQLVAPGTTHTPSELPNYVRAIDALEEMQQENAEYFPERVEPTLATLRQERDRLGNQLLAEIERALDQQHRDRAEQLLTLLLQGAPELAEQHAPRIGRRLQELRYLESVAGATPYGSPSAASANQAPGQATATPYGPAGSPYGSAAPPHYGPPSPYASPLASQGVAETIVLNGAGYAPPAYPTAHPQTPPSPARRRLNWHDRRLWAAAGVAIFVLAAGIGLFARAAGSAAATAVPVTSSSLRGCEFLVSSFAKQGGRSLRCVPADAATANTEVQTGKAPFAISTDDLTGQQAATMRSTRIFREMLILVTSRDHPLAKNLSVTDINALFTGGQVDQTHLDPSCSRPTVIMQPVNSAETQFLAEKAHIRAFAPGLTEAGTDDAMINAVGNNDCSLGFVSADAVTGEVQPIALAGVDPSSSNFKLQLVAYPLIRWVYLIQRNPDPVKPQPDRDGSTWLKYIISPQGQQALAANGFTPRFQY